MDDLPASWRIFKASEVPIGRLLPEDTRAQTHFRCPKCHAHASNLMTGFIRTVYMVQIECTDCGFKAVYYKDLGLVEPHNRWVSRLDAEGQAHKAIADNILNNPEKTVVHIADSNTQQKLIDYGNS